MDTNTDGQPLAKLMLRMTVGDKQRFRIAAAQEGVSMSEFLRRAGRERAKLIEASAREPARPTG